jgi:2-desacetyl-2-hydroxyethyl bacteriochlorophyllide A dehydrogenase
MAKVGASGWSIAVRRTGLGRRLDTAVGPTRGGVIVKAAVLKALGKRLVVEEVPKPKPSPGEVLVESWACGLCGTDLHLCDGLAYVPHLPHIPGHEPAGVVVELGEGVTELHVGQRVVPHLFVTCGTCDYCRSGRDAQCSGVMGILGVLMPGALAEYFTIPAANVFELPDSISFQVGGLIADAVLTAVHASRRSRLRVGETAVVLGAGGVGQCLIQILFAAGVRVIAVDQTREKRESASALGAALALPASAGAVRDFTDGQGAHAVFECVGKAETMAQAASYVRRGGQIIVIGEEPEFPKIDTIQIAQRELEVLGSRNGSRRDLRDAIRFVAAGTIRPRIARTFALEEINEALAFFRAGCDGRVVITIKSA